jgi:phenylacetate-CoA ligase
MWSERRVRGDRSSIELLENWPVLKKDQIRLAPRAFLADGINMSRQIKENTSGSTGTPLSFWLSQNAVQSWYALFEARCKNWYGVSIRDRWGIFGGQLIVPYKQTHPPYWVWNAGLKQLYLSSYHLAPYTAGHYVDAIQKHNLTYLLGYPSSLYSLARFLNEQSLKPPKLKVIISNAEPLFAYQRELISAVFQCPVYDTYGLSENVCGASECSYGSMHIWPDAGISEVFSNTKDQPVPTGETGRLICTGLLNMSMPLIRYEVGDQAVFSVNPHCKCGRSLPIFSSIEGRSDDVIITRDGRRIGRLDTAFKADLPIREAQIIQEAIDHIHVLYVPADGCTDADISRLKEKLQNYLGDMTISMAAVALVPRSANGKFRAVLSKIR